jgi:excisionase family DNA binding protein
VPKKTGCCLHKTIIYNYNIGAKIMFQDKKTNEIKPMLISISDAIKLCGISRSTFYCLMNSGKTPEPVKLGKRVLFNKKEFERWIELKCPPRSKWEVMCNAA